MCEDEYVCVADAMQSFVFRIAARNSNNMFCNAP